MDSLTHVRREDTNVRLNHEGINKDVTMKIFSKLGIKDLMRFKCVSKHWDRIISDPMLAKLYIKTKATTNILLFLDLNNKKARASCLRPGRPLYGPHKCVSFEGREVPLPPEIGPTARVLGYADGLVCMSGDAGEILLYNPSTRECRVLTLPDGCSDRRALSSKRSSVDEDMGRLEIAGKKKERPSKQARQLSGGPSLGIVDIKEYETCSKLARPSKSKRSGVDEDTSRFGIVDTEEYETCSNRAHPSKMSGVDEDIDSLQIADKKDIIGDAYGASGRCQRIYLGGIGYDRKTCDYKVVAIFFESYNSKENNKVMVFPLRENSWREVRGDFPYSLGCNFTYRVPVNGAIHWFVRDKNRARVIVSFDPSIEEFREIPAPDHMDYVTVAQDPHCKSDLGALEGRLVVILHNLYDLEGRFYIQVWLMEEYGVRASWRRIELHATFNDPQPNIELTLKKKISLWSGPMFMCKNGKVWVKNAPGTWYHTGLLDGPGRNDCILTPMGFRNTMLAFQANPVSPFAGLS